MFWTHLHVIMGLWHEMFYSQCPTACENASVWWIVFQTDKTSSSNSVEANSLNRSEPNILSLSHWPPLSFHLRFRPCYEYVYIFTCVVFNSISFLLTQTDIPDQVIRVFKADQQSCYIIISKDTTAKDVVSHVVSEFGLIAASETYSLCEVSVSPEGVIKQRRLPDQLSKLADRIQLNGR